MKLIKSLLCLLLIPFALFLTSCNNEIPEDFVIEFIPYDDEDSYTPDDVDYLELTLNKEPDDEGGENNQGTNIPPVFEGRLYKGEILQLGDLEPGRYTLEGTARKITGTDFDWIVGSVYAVSDKMETEIIEDGRDTIYNNYLIIDEFSPTVVKLIVYLYYNPGP
ncbi:MAG: hypothetical protein IKQ43_07155 [Treponema sp.]|nr:hypothetical protein [Treponema sp.]